MEIIQLILETQAPTPPNGRGAASRHGSAATVGRIRIEAHAALLGTPRD